MEKMLVTFQADKDMFGFCFTIGIKKKNYSLTSKY